MKLNHLCLAVVIGAAALPSQGNAQPATAQLLATFCAPSDIKGAACKRAKGYPNGRTCDVTLEDDRYAGKLVAGRNILIAGYDSKCEAHVNEFGGAVLFEQTGTTFAFRGYQPGYAPHNCIVLTGADTDRLVCLTGHVGQGVLESGVAEMLFKPGAKGIRLSYDFFARAEDTNGAYGANTVDCKDSNKNFTLDKLAAGPRRDTVAVEIEYADAAVIKTACAGGFSKPEQTFREPVKGEAYVPNGKEKKGRFVIDLATRKMMPEAEFGKGR